MSDSNIFKNKKVLVTGHTGFKGSWLSLILKYFEAKVHGFSNKVPTELSHYKFLNGVFDKDLRQNVNDFPSLKKYIAKNRPDFIFHLAAQPLVFESILNPLETFKTNTIGTANLLESLRLENYPCTAVIITSDKVYRNNEWKKGYKESDFLGGKDPYSGSKGAAELVLNSYINSYFKSPESKVKIGIGRAGNVVGGGDWAPNRIIPDAMKCWSKNDILQIRHPNSTRPWQHVLEPLSGYLKFAEFLKKKKVDSGEAFNFGPHSNVNHSVLEVVNTLSKYWKNPLFEVKETNDSSEAGLLKLNSSKALSSLNWKTKLSFKETMEWTSEWYFDFYNRDIDPQDLSMDQIIRFFE